MITESRPEIFNLKYDVSGCFCEANGEILLLKRLPEKSYGNKWALPGGKAELGETAEEAALREVLEETGMNVADSLSFVSKMYEKYSDGDFIYNVFHAVLPQKPDVKLSPEHADYRWVSPSQALKMDLIEDLDVCIKLVYGSSLQPS